jgi:hypothetical protein
VSGGCFPSAHVSGTWALTFGLLASHARAGLIFAALATGSASRASTPATITRWTCWPDWRWPSSPPGLAG